MLAINLGCPEKLKLMVWKENNLPDDFYLLVLLLLLFFARKVKCQMEIDRVKR